MVGSEHDNRVFIQAAVFQSLNDPSHLLVYSRDACVVVGNVTAEIISVVRSAGRNVGHGGGNLLYVERSI